MTLAERGCTELEGLVALGSAALGASPESVVGSFGVIGAGGTACSADWAVCAGEAGLSIFSGPMEFIGMRIVPEELDRGAGRGFSGFGNKVSAFRSGGFFSNLS